MNTEKFGHELQSKIDILKARRTPLKLGSVDFASPLILAPMSSICAAPFRLMMEELGAGGTVSELISCHGINHGNERTRKMLTVDENERHVGTQLFGEDAAEMAKAAVTAASYGPRFIDINMGCPVRKVVTKGGGSALLKEPKKLATFFRQIKDGLSIPLTIKIRTGWDETNLNAIEVTEIAKAAEGVEFVAIHGRTRAQQYRGHANWDYLETVAKNSALPIIGNGDLNVPSDINAKLSQTNCDGLMVGRGALRNPFIFLEAYITEDERDHLYFTPADYWEVILRYYRYLSSYTEREHTVVVQLKKHIVWFAAGLPNCASFRKTVFSCKDIPSVLNAAENYFTKLAGHRKAIDFSQGFLSSVHG